MPKQTLAAYCALRSQAHEQHIYGSASIYSACILIHANIPFPKRLDDAFLDSPWYAQLKAFALQQSARLILVKAGDEPKTPTLFTYVDIKNRRHTTIAITALKDAIAHYNTVLTSVVSWNDEPIYLVCTNGKKDKCCAKFGLPIFKHLKKTHSEKPIYQCSHIGGDRFAPNIVVLPFGNYYGRLTIETAENVVAQTLNNAIFLPNYRGNSLYTFEEQHAEYFFRKTLNITTANLPIHITKQNAINDQLGFKITSEGEHYSMQLTKSYHTDYLTCTANKPARIAKYSLENFKHHS